MRISLFKSVITLGLIFTGVAATASAQANDKRFMIKTDPYLLVRPAFDDKFKFGAGLDLETILGLHGTFGFYFKFLSRNVVDIDRTDALFGFHTNVYVIGNTETGGFIFRPKAGFGFPSTGGFYGHLGAGAMVQVIASSGLVLELGAQVMTRPLYISGAAEGLEEVQVEFLTGLGFVF